MKTYYVYIITNKPYGVLYVGVTSNLDKRIYQHKNKVADGFTKKYNCTLCVWYEMTNDVHAALTKEKQLKKWNRNWKLRLINETNPSWKSLV